MSAADEKSEASLMQTLQAAGRGDRQAAAELLPQMYDELRRLARARLARVPAGTTLQPTALVHEAYLKLVGSRDPGWDGRGHFFAAAARAMRNILVDRARRRAAAKHGGERKRTDLDDVDLALEPPSVDILALDEALQQLEREDERKVQVVMLHYFGGLTLEETAAALGVSVPTVQREWRFTRTLLFTRLSEKNDEPG